MSDRNPGPNRPGGDGPPEGEDDPANAVNRSETIESDPGVELPDEARRELENHPNVHATGIGPKEVDGRPTGRMAAIAFVTEKVPNDRLPENDRIPEHIRGIPTDVQVSSEFTHDVSAGASGREARHRPFLAGCSIGHSDPTKGSGSCSPRFIAADGTHVVLTNRHVATLDDTHNSVGDAMIQPGSSDGGSSPGDDFGVVKELGPWDTTVGGINETDSALISVNDPADVAPRGVHYNRVAGFEDPVFGPRYVQDGHTTGLTSSYLSAVDVETTVDAKDYVGLVAFKPISQGGDSGSCYTTVDTETGEATIRALHFAGSSTRALGVPIETVQKHHGTFTPVPETDTATLNPPASTDANYTADYFELTPLKNNTDAYNDIPFAVANPGGDGTAVTKAARLLESSTATAALDEENATLGYGDFAYVRLNTAALASGRYDLHSETPDSSEAVDTIVAHEPAQAGEAAGGDGTITWGKAADFANKRASDRALHHNIGVGASDSVQLGYGQDFIDDSGIPWYVPLHDTDARAQNYGTYRHRYGDYQVLGNPTKGHPGVAGGNSYYFDGTGDYINLFASDYNRQAFTLAAWIHPEAPVNTSGGILCRYRQDQNAREYQFEIYPDTASTGFILFGVFSDPADFATRQSVQAANIPYGEWSHVAAVFDGSDEMVIYVNGTRIEGALTGFSEVGEATAKTYIGLRDTDYTRYYNGYATEVMKANRALSAAEVATLADMPSAGSLTTEQKTVTFPK